MYGNMQKYQVFVKTVEYGSFSKAAEILSYSQSAISKMVAELEKEWGMVLLERDRSGIRLTADGAHMLPYAQTMVDEYNRLVQEIQDIADVKTGELRIASFSSVAIHWLPKMLAEFRKDYPLVEVELLLGGYGEIADWVKSGRVDCAFTRFIDKGALDMTIVDEDEWVVIMPEGHPLTELERIPVSMLGDYDFLLEESEGDHEVEDFLVANEVYPKYICRTWDDYAIMSMVRHGMGISLFPGLMLKGFDEGIEVRPLDPPMKRQIAFVVRNQKTMSTVTKRFLKYLGARDK